MFLGILSKVGLEAYNNEIENVSSTHKYPNLNIIRQTRRKRGRVW